jgi:hypothetical protein
MLLPPSCSASSQVHSKGASQSWTEISETMSQNESFLLLVIFLRYLFVSDKKLTHLCSLLPGLGLRTWVEAGKVEERKSRVARRRTNRRATYQDPSFLSHCYHPGEQIWTLGLQGKESFHSVFISQTWTKLLWAKH